MDNGAQFVDKVLEVSNFKTIEMNGHTYHSNHIGSNLVVIPTAEKTKLFSLNQVLGFVDNLVKTTDKKFLINVLDHENVEVIESTLNKNLKRNVYAEATSTKITNTFKFGQFMDQEDFIIEVMTKFIITESREKLLSFISMVKTEESNERNDNSYTQSVVVRKGSALVANADVVNLWSLKSFKSFPEIEQPEIPYILRVRGDSFALFECDGGAWKVETAGKIKEYLDKNIDEVLKSENQRITVL